MKENALRCCKIDPLYLARDWIFVQGCGTIEATAAMYTGAEIIFGQEEFRWTIRF